MATDDPSEAGELLVSRVLGETSSAGGFTPPLKLTAIFAPEKRNPWKVFGDFEHWKFQPFFRGENVSFQEGNFGFRVRNLGKFLEVLGRRCVSIIPFATFSSLKPANSLQNVAKKIHVVRI